MPEPSDPTLSPAWSSETSALGIATEPVDAPESLAWRSALAEALRANGFEVSPPAIDDDPFGDDDEVAGVDAIEPAPDLEDAAGADAGAWWAEAEEARQHASAWAEPTPLVFTDPIADEDLMAGDVAPAMDAGPTGEVTTDEAAHPDADAGSTDVEPAADADPSAVADGWEATDTEVGPSAEVPHEPVAAATEPAPSLPSAAVLAAQNPVAPTPVAPTTAAGSAPPSPPAFLAGRLARSAVVAAGPADAAATPADEEQGSADPRDALEWPEPDLATPEDEDLGDLRAEAVAWFAAEDATDDRAEDAAEDPVPPDDPSPVDATVAEHGWPVEDMPPVAEQVPVEAALSSAIEPGSPWMASAPPDVAAAADELVPMLEPDVLAAEPVEPATITEPIEPDALPPVLEVDAPVELDPRRVEFLGYQDAAAPMPATAATDPRAFTPPSGSITDIGRRPPGARPTASAAPRAATDPGSVPQPGPAATGADLWDMVTAPAVATVSTEPAEGRGSRAATVLLTVLVVLVILALVVGFLYSFTGLLGM